MESSGIGEPVGTVARLARFPIKSMLGEDLARAVITERGLVGDRAYGLVDVESGALVSAKHPRKWGPVLQLRASFVDEPEVGGAVPPVAIAFPDGTAVRSDDPACDETISCFLGRVVRLVPAEAGARFEEVWPAIDGLAPTDFIASTTTSTEGTDPVSTLDASMMLPGAFFDFCALHLLTTSTLAALEEANATASFDWRRYRPNVLVDSTGAGFVENAWAGRQVGVGSAVAVGIIPTMRCVMTTLAHGDLPADRASLQTIARVNRLEIGGLGEWACAGLYANVASSGEVAVGDPVHLGGPVQPEVPT